MIRLFMLKLNINEIKFNENSPRKINKEKLEKLCKSIKDFPEMTYLRPIILNEDNVVLGGNMRLLAFKKLNISEVPILYNKDLTIEKQREFIIKYNLSFGEWDWDILACDFDNELLIDGSLDELQKIGMKFKLMKYI